MTSDSRDQRYRDGYAAGDRDASIPSSEEDESRMRRHTGDPWADDGYVRGFFAARRAIRTRAFSGVARLTAAFRSPRFTGWLRRLSARPRETP
jgi:hypothetical protein